MAVNFPSTLQQLLNEASFSYSFGNTKLESNTETGEPKVRNRYTKMINEINGSILIKVEEIGNQFITFENFYKTTLVNGTLTFNYNHPLRLSEAEFRFKGSPKIDVVGGQYFNLSFTWIEVWES